MQVGKTFTMYEFLRALLATYGMPLLDPPLLSPSLLPVGVAAGTPTWVTWHVDCSGVRWETEGKPFTRTAFCSNRSAKHLWGLQL